MTDTQKIWTALRWLFVGVALIVLSCRICDLENKLEAHVRMEQRQVEIDLARYQARHHEAHTNVNALYCLNALIWGDLARDAKQKRASFGDKEKP